MKKTATFLSFLLIISFIGFGQNVGIGTSTPAFAYKLHIHDGVANQDVSIGLTNSLTTNANLRGTRLRMLNSDFIIMNYETAGKINLSTNSNTRMIIDAIGNVGINTASPNYALQVTAINKYGIYSTATENGTDTIAGVYGLALSPTPVPYSAGVRGESNSTDYNGIGVLGVHSGSGWGVAGFVKELGSFAYGSGVYGAAGSPLSGYGNGGYGVYGVNNNTDGVAGFFNNNSGSVGSRALVTNGALQLKNIGEANGKVLTSDIAGNATWQSLSGTHNHYGETWVGNSTVGLEIQNTNTVAGNAVAIRGNASGSGNNTSRGVEGISNSTGGIGVFGANTSGGSPGGAPNSGVVGTSGTGAGIFGASNSGISVYGFKQTGSSNSVARFQNASVNNTSPVVLIENAANNPTALELSNGYIKVSGANKTAFTVTATAGNSSGHILELNYANQSNTDILIVTHNYSPPGGPTAYHNQNVGVFWNGLRWTIYNENTLAPILGISFNVLVIKQ